SLSGLYVRSWRMCVNLDATDVLLWAEAASISLAPDLGRPRAQQLVAPQGVTRRVRACYGTIITESIGKTKAESDVP
ncbi:MAG: hypothetical protein ABGZ17_05230, partial [Planctomycetaceae bacterium]